MQGPFSLLGEKITKEQEELLKDLVLTQVRHKSGVIPN